MSVVRKSIDLDFLAGELRKHGKVLSRCEECGRLFTEVQTAMLHRKVHSSVTILLPTTSGKHKKEAPEPDRESTVTSTVVPQAASGNTIIQSVGHSDYSFIMEAIANANDTMTFADLEKISSKMIQGRKSDSGLEFGMGVGSSRKSPYSSSVDSGSLNVNTEVFSNHSETNKQASMVNRYEPVDRTGSYSKPGFTSKSTGSKESTGNIYNNNIRLNTESENVTSNHHSRLNTESENLASNHHRVKLNTVNQAMESNHHVTLHNQPNTVGHDWSNQDVLSQSNHNVLSQSNHNVLSQSNHNVLSQSNHKVLSGQSVELVDSLDFSSDQLVQQLMGGSSFLQLLNEPLDESFDALYKTASCNSNTNNMNCGSPYVDHNKHNASLTTQSNNTFISNNLCGKSQISVDQRTFTSPTRSTDIGGFNNNRHVRNHPIGSKVEERTIASPPRSSDICGFNNNTQIRNHPIGSNIEERAIASPRGSTDICGFNNNTQIRNHPIGSNIEERAIASPRRSTDICGFNNNSHIRNRPSIVSNIEERTIASHEGSNDGCGLNKTVSLKRYSKSLLSVNIKDQLKESSPNDICDLIDTQSVQSTGVCNTQQTQTVDFDDDVEMLESTGNKPHSRYRGVSGNSGDKNVTKTSNGVVTVGKDNATGKAVISLSALHCKQCDLKFQTFQELVCHMSVSHNMVISKCSKCGQIFYDAEAVKKHLLIHKPIVPLAPRTYNKRFGRFVEKCPVCRQEFGNWEMFKTHMLSHPYPYTFSPESLTDASADRRLNVKKPEVIDCDSDIASNEEIVEQKEPEVDCNLISDIASNEENGEQKSMFGKKKRKKKGNKKSKMVFDEDVEEVSEMMLEEGVRSRLRSSKRSKEAENLD